MNNHAKRFFPPRFLRDRRAIAATEFALFAPMVMGAILVMADLGLAIGEQIRLQQTVRTGAEFVMAGVSDTAELRDLMEAAASGVDSQDRDDVSLGGLPLVDAVRSCRCSSESAAVACTTVCASRPAYIFYDLSAEKTYGALFIPDIDLRAETRVQVR
ncbi:MAG: TadE/TadG family type IV pilus assembly protein [Amphiplicatus sp.]